MNTGTAVILAGGKSSRMGFDKQQLKLGNVLLVEHIIGELKPLFSEIVVISNTPQNYKHLDCRVISDIIRDFGPLGGIHTGLAHSGSLFAYFTACDMPNINIEYIRYMQQRMEETEETIEAVITRFGSWVEPFNAFYHKSLTHKIEEQIQHDQRQINLMLRSANVLYIEEQDARVFSPDWSMFHNINTMEEYEAYINNHKILNT